MKFAKDILNLIETSILVILIYALGTVLVFAGTLAFALILGGIASLFSSNG